MTQTKTITSDVIQYKSWEDFRIQNILLIKNLLKENAHLPPKEKGEESRTLFKEKEDGEDTCKYKFIFSKIEDLY